MAAAEYDLHVDQGETFRRVFRWKDDADEVIPLTGWHAHLHVRVGDAEPVVELADGAGLTLGGNAGTITVELDDVATAALLPTPNLRYDLFLVSPDDERTRLLAGRVIVAERVTVVP